MSLATDSIASGPLAFAFNSTLAIAQTNPAPVPAPVVSPAAPRSVYYQAAVYTPPVYDSLQGSPVWVGAPSTGSAVTGASGQPFYNVQTALCNALIDGATLNALGNGIYPFIVEVATFTFNAKSQFVGASLYGSLLNPVAASTCGFFALRKSSPFQSSVDNQNKFLDIFSLQNSLPGVPSPSNKEVSVSFPDNQGFLFDSGETVGLYACAPNDATVQLQGALSIYYIPYNG